MVWNCIPNIVYVVFNGTFVYPTVFSDTTTFVARAGNARGGHALRHRSPPPLRIYHSGDISGLVITIPDCPPEFS